MTRFSFDRAGSTKGKDSSLQRTLSAPLLGAALVVLCALAAGRDFLLGASPVAVTGFFCLVAGGASLAAGLFAPRAGRVLVLAIAIGTTGVAGLLLFKLAGVRAGTADAAPADLSPWLALAALIPRAGASMAGAAAGAASRRWMARRALR